MHPKICDAINEIDAALFSSDVFENEDAAKELRKWIDRWDRELVLREMQNSRCQICGGENH